MLASSRILLQINVQKNKTIMGFNWTRAFGTHLLYRHMYRDTRNWRFRVSPILKTGNLTNGYKGWRRFGCNGWFPCLLFQKVTCSNPIRALRANILAGTLVRYWRNVVPWPVCFVMVEAKGPLTFFWKISERDRIILKMYISWWVVFLHSYLLNAFQQWMYIIGCSAKGIQTLWEMPPKWKCKWKMYIYLQTLKKILDY